MLNVIGEFGETVYDLVCVPTVIYSMWQHGDRDICFLNSNVIPEPDKLY